MSAAYRSAATASALVAASTGVTVNKPSGVADGDVLYAFISKNTAADTNGFTNAAGFTAIGGNPFTVTENDRHLGILRKVIVTASGEPSTYTFVTTSGTTSGLVGIIVCVSGADTNTPEDVTFTSSHRVLGENDATPASVDVITVTANSLVLQYCILALGVAAQKTWGAPSGYTQDAAAVQGETTSASNKLQCGVAYKTQVAAGSAGTNAWLHTADDAATDYIVAVVSVRSAPATRPIAIRSRF